MSPPGSRPGLPTHAISRSQNFYVLSPSAGPRPVLESGCKDTTFFQTTKTFFYEFRTRFHEHAGSHRVGRRIFFHFHRDSGRNRAGFRRNQALFFEKSGCFRSGFRKGCAHVVGFQGDKLFLFIRKFSLLAVLQRVADLRIL